MKKLDVLKLNLNGRHLIEASAGTGKTYNITKIFLRLLLEKVILEKENIGVQNILIMTFTKAATEELRGRIDKEIRTALEQINQTEQSEDFYRQLFQDKDKETVTAILKAALLELDEAAIFTIHGFCARVLKNQAFFSGIALDIDMQADTEQLLLQCVRDWFRQINHSPEQFNLLMSKNWHTPDKFYELFKTALKSNEPLVIGGDIAESIEDLQLQKKKIVQDLLAHENEIIIPYINKDDKDKELFAERWEHLKLWFENDRYIPCEEIASKFINGNRFKAKKYEAIKNTLKPIKDFIEKYNQKCDELIYSLIVDGIKLIRRRFAETKNKAAAMDFDDLIHFLSKRVLSKDGQALIDALQKQYPYALVDEFQDTDPAQFTILDKLYPQKSVDSALFMIGDPKQAIYSFRGGDIFTYLSAREKSDYSWYMDTNWRSLKNVVNGYNRLFMDKPLEQELINVFGYGISYQAVEYSPNTEAAKNPLEDKHPERAAINYCYLSEIDGETMATADEWKSAIAFWCVEEIQRLLNQLKIGSKNLHENDIAILVRSKTEAKLIKKVLSQHHFSSVYLSEKDSIYASNQARELLQLLKGILDCENNRLLTVALSTTLLGGNAQKLLAYRQQEDDKAWDKLFNEINQLRSLWIKQGLITMLTKIIKEFFQPQPTEHERALSNMIQLMELLQQASIQYKQPRQLIHWFEEQIKHPDNNEEAQLRLESDEALIRIITMHGSKGLEYPIVFIPFASYYSEPIKVGNSTTQWFKYHDHDKQQTLIQIGASQNAKQRVNDEGHAESIRLLYVAVTRAVYRCYIGVCSYNNSRSANKSELSALAKTLNISDRSQWEEVLHQMTDNSPECALIGMNSSAATEQVTLTEKDKADKEIIDETIHVQQFKQDNIDEKWLMHSFTSLDKNKKTFAESGFAIDRDESYITAGKTKQSSNDALRFRIKKGSDSGNLLHDIFQQLNFKEPQFQQSILEPLRHFRDKTISVEELSDWISDCLQTPIPLLDSEGQTFTLSDLNHSQTLRETQFYFPLQQLSLKKLKTYLTKYRNQETSLQTINDCLSGMMCGYIDLIFEYQGKYYLADYKSTYLGNTLNDYRFDKLNENNIAHNYDLQYLIYSIALHRYLQNRLENYHPQQHFGGIYYFYLRGMSKESTDFSGIYYTQLSTELLLKLDKLFCSEIIGESQP